MFIVTRHKLFNYFDIDPDIASFFADRVPPANNHYWKRKRVYLSSGFGYSMIPLFFDLQFRLGVSKVLLLKEEHIQLMEAGFDILSQYEAKLVTYNYFVSSCYTKLMPHVKNGDLFSNLFAHLNGSNPTTTYKLSTPARSLNRADAFLLTLCDLEIDEITLVRIINAFYYLKIAVLIIDDVEDFPHDNVHNEENSIIELGGNPDGFIKVLQLFIESHEEIKKINPKAAGYILKSFNAVW